VAAIVSELGWTGPVYALSALAGSGTRQLVYDIMNFLESEAAVASSDD